MLSNRLISRGPGACSLCRFVSRLGLDEGSPTRLLTKWSGYVVAVLTMRSICLTCGRSCVASHCA